MKLGGEIPETVCLVTGVAGFVGSHLAESLLDLGYKVIGVDNFFSGLPDNLAGFVTNPNFTFYEESIAKPRLLSILKNNHKELNYCFHLAAVVSVPYSLDHPEETMDINYHATVAMIREAEQLGFRAFVFAGSAAEYGHESRLPLLENYANSETRHLSPYGYSKYLASCATASIPQGTALRCFNIYGPRQEPGSPYSGVISRFVDVSLKGKALPIYGDGCQTRDFIYVSDVVEAYLHAAGLAGRKKRGQGGGIFNVGTGKGTSILELAKTTNELTCNRASFVFHPQRNGDIRLSVASIKAFHKATGWKPAVSLHEGLAKTIQWLAMKRWSQSQT